MNWKNRLIGLLLLLLPVILSLLGRQLLYEDPMQLARERLDERLETAFAEIEAGRGFAEHFTRTFRQFERQVFSASEPARVLPSLVARIEDTYRVKLQGVLLDGRGVPIREFLDRPVSRQLIQRFFHAYQAFVNTGKPLPSIEQGFVKSFLGRFVPVATQIHGRFLFASADPQRSYLYMSAPRPRGMLFLFFHVETQPTSLAAQELIRTIMSRDPRLRLCFRGVDEVATRTAEALKLPVEQIPEILAALEQSATGSLWLGNTLVKRRILEPSMSVIGAADVLPPLVWWDHWPRVLLGTMLSLGGLLLFVLLLERPFAESVRFKLIGAFLYSSLLPLIIMGLSALSALEEQRRVLERETHQRIENDLFRFDQEFDQFVGTLRGGLMTRYFQDVDGRGASLTTFLEQLERVEKSWRFDTCVVYDRSGTLVFEHQVKGGRPVLGNVVVSFGKLAKTVLSRTIRRAPEATEKSREDSLFESLSASPHLNMIDWGALKFYFGILPFGDLPDSVTHLAALFWHPSRMQHHFLADRLMTFNRYIGDGEIFVWSHTGEGPPLPPDSPRAGILRPLLGRVTSWAVGLRRKVKINDQVYLATGLRFRMLSEFSAIRLTPDLLIQRQVDAVSLRMRVIVLIITAFCLLIGVVLSRLFLVPVAQLTRGLDALRRQEFGFRIGIEQADELGEAARLLDQTSEDLQDLEVARTLQETFYPSSGVSVGEWRIWGRSRFAGSVGGDYVDFFKVSEQQAILIIGDVSGHGIGAALVVAMARAAFAHPAVQGNPQRMMESLNTLFVRTLKRRKMMSCCLAFVDAEQRTVTMVNAGHQWPLLVRNQRAEFLPTQGFPVGAARNWSAGSRTLEVASDDVLFWYSDGLVEALDRQGISLGYKRLQDDLPSLCGNTPEETEGNVWRWFARLSPADPPEDDVSVLILQHQVVVGPRPGEVA